MGLNVSSIKYLCLIKEKFGVEFDKVVMLGRQDLIISDADLQNVCSVLGYQNSIDSVRGNDHFSDMLFFNLFRSKKVDSVDYCDYDGATISLDLNEPMPDTYEEQYDLVLDGGTLEHVFNYPIALQNAMRMCKVAGGGHLVLATPTNGYNGHGFYQFSPELFIAVLNNNGFYVEDITYMEEYGNEIYKAYRVEGISERELNADKRALIYVCAKKVDPTPSKLRAQQGNWEALWEGKKRVLENGTLRFYDLDREMKNQLGGEIKEYNYFSGKNILLYGAGYVCRFFLKTMRLENIKIIGIADKNAENINIEGFLVEDFAYFKKYSFDYIVITTDKKITSEIKKDLINKYDCCEESIITFEEFGYYMKPCLYEEE